MLSSISGLVVEYIVAIDVTRVRFPADALLLTQAAAGPRQAIATVTIQRVKSNWVRQDSRGTRPHAFADPRARPTERFAWCRAGGRIPPASFESHVFVSPTTRHSIKKEKPTSAATKAITNTNHGHVRSSAKCPASRNRTGDHLIAAVIYSQMLYQLSYRRVESKTLRDKYWSISSTLLSLTSPPLLPDCICKNNLLTE